MKRPFFQLTTLVTLLVLFLLNISEAEPVRDGIPGAEAEVWQDAVLQKFYGPWSDVRKANGENADYNDYGAHIQDFEPSNEDVPADSPEVVYSAEEADFQSNYGEAGGADDQSTSNQDDGDRISEESPEIQESEGDVQWPTSGIN